MDTMARKQLSTVEFVPLMALLTAFDALSIDSMLPALADMGRDLGATGANDAQLIISMIFVGFAFGQIVGGPLSDSIGRKPAIYWGLAVYSAATILAILATSFPVMLAARVLQGFGCSIPLVVMSAMVRDLYAGAPMARIMSFIGSVFIIVPIIAPLLGQGILLIGHWRLIFAMLLMLIVPVTIWFAIRQPETLPPERRVPFRPAPILAAVRQVLSRRLVVGYIVAEGLLFGAFLGHLTSAQQIFQDIYDRGATFAFYFSGLALVIGIGLYGNGKVVERYGMQHMTTLGFAGLTATAVLFLPIAYGFAGVPPLWLYVSYLAITFIFAGILFGNINALAMEPLGEIAGVGAAVVGLATTFIGLPFGTAIGQSFNGTILPQVLGFALLGGLAWLAMIWAERQRHLLAVSG